MPQTDLIVQSPDKQTQAVIEIKKRVPASADWAARMRRNLYAHLFVPPAKFFLMALPERFYLWKDAATTANVPPDYEADAQKILKPYAGHLSAPLPQLSEFSLELLVRSWLEDVLSGRMDRAELARSQSWLVESGLYDAIKNGSIQLQQKSA